ncbi:MAG: HutD family protein [Negativicutes bacterium]|nr:HutD family protein [Negativicutes bacterium]
MKKIRLRKMPKLGLRNIKTALSIVLCIWFYHVIDRGTNGALLATIAAVICMQDSIQKSVKEGLNRVSGTILGGFLGVLFMYLPMTIGNYILWISFIFLGIVLYIYLCNVFRIRDSIIIGTIVFLIIVLDEKAHDLPWLYAINRVLDTFAGILVAVCVNYFLFRPKPDQVARELEEVDFRYVIAEAEKQKLFHWSGGTTTELFIYPEDCLYGDRDFEWRISSAKVLLKSSNFTKLPDYMRRLMVLEGKMKLAHQDQHQVVLAPYDQDYFDGDWATRSQGCCTDFNVMLQDGQEGKIEALPKTEKRGFDSSLFTSYYVLADEVVLKISQGTKVLVEEKLAKSDFILFYPLEEANASELTICLMSPQDTGDSMIAVETVIIPLEEG